MSAIISKDNKSQMCLKDAEIGTADDNLRLWIYNSFSFMVKL